MTAHHHQGSCRTATILLLLLGTAPHCTTAFLSVPNTVHLLVPQPSLSRHRAGVIEKKNAFDGKTGRGGSSMTSSSALASAPLPLPPLPMLSVVGSGIAKFYKAFPLIAGFLTCSTKAGLADSMAQYRDDSTTKFDPKRNLAMVLYSGLVLGILCEIMYNKLFPLVFGTAEKCIFKAIKMTLFDGFVNAPLLWLPPAYIVKAILYRNPIREGIQKYVTDVKENGLLTKYWSLWLPMSMINFMFVPDHFRIAFVAMVSFFWMVILSMVSNQNNGEDNLVKSEMAG